MDMGAYEYPGKPQEVELKWLPEGFTLVWPSIPGESYTVIFSEDFLSWHVAASIIPSGGATTAWSDPMAWLPAVRTRFYRVTLSK